MELQAQLIAALEADDEAGVPVQLGIGSVCSRSSPAGNTTVQGPLRFTCLVVLVLDVCADRSPLPRRVTPKPTRSLR